MNPVSKEWLDIGTSIDTKIHYAPDSKGFITAIDFAESNGIVDALEIADALQLDVFEVNEIMVQLIKEGILEEL